ncbi:SprT-like domain-containing protein [Halobacteriovorax sp.]|uniref:SprT-like domain-containing protein n=1 Tax=Halobacteriovorax sp. TaxID=2020862 RepID=UPI00356ABDC1
MQVYSKSTQKFLKICKAKAKDILTSEMKIEFNRSRIKWKNYSVPLSFVVFEHNSNLGFFNHHLYQIGLNKRLLLLNDAKILADVIRHELAHLEAYLLYSNSVNDHGPEYRSICKSHGWGEEVFSAKLELATSLPEFKRSNTKQDKLVSRVQKLLSLANSDNINESRLATAKANELLLKFNLNEEDLTEEEDETFLLKVLEGSKVNSKAKAIYEILTTFNVQPVFSHAKGHYYLEVVGSRVNVELAHYVCDYLVFELDHLWRQTQKENKDLKGLSAKNSFFRGVAVGYKEQITNVQATSFSKNDLMILKEDLEVRVKNVYSRLSYSSSQRVKNNSKGAALGKSAGKNLKIKKSISSSSTRELLK